MDKRLSRRDAIFKLSHFALNCWPPTLASPHGHVNNLSLPLLLHLSRPHPSTPLFSSVLYTIPLLPLWPNHKLHLSTHSPIHPSTYPSIHPPIFSFLHPSIRSSICPPIIHLSTHPIIHLSIHPSFHSSTISPSYLFICPTFPHFALSCYPPTLLYHSIPRDPLHTPPPQACSVIRFLH